VSGIVCRRLGPEDLPLIEAAPPEVFDHPVHPGAARAFLESGSHLLVGAIEEGAAPRLVGFVSAVVVLHPDRARPELWINEVGVAGGRRGRGVGRTLIEETLRVARARGCRGAWVALDEDNAAALALYRSAGGAEPRSQLHIEFGYEVWERRREAPE